MRVLNSPTNRAIAGAIAAAGLIFTGITIDAWGEPETWKFVLRLALFLSSIWLVGQVLLQSRLGQVQLPRRLQIWSTVYWFIVLLAFLLAIGVQLLGGRGIDVGIAAALLGFGVIGFCVWGTVGYVVVLLPVWALSEAALFAWRRLTRTSIPSRGEP